MKRTVPEDPCAARERAAAVNPDASPREEVVIVDEKNHVVGRAFRSVMRKRGLIHRAAYVLVFNSRGQLFVQERTLAKDIFPGYRDLCAGGVVLAGESYEESAARELGEELGVRDAELKYLFDFYGEYLGQKVWGRAFSCTAEGPFTLQPEEVSGGSFHSIDSVMEMVGQGICTPDSVYVLLRHLEDRRGRQGKDRD